MIHLIFSFILSVAMAQKQSNTIYEYSFTGINGEQLVLEQFRGKKIMFVNVASECGYTPQYASLQELHTNFGDRLVIIGFPCNQFGSQEPGNESEIASFCQKNYGVEFLMASKIDVKGANQHPIYQWLCSKELNGKENTKIMWNFEKFIIDENGNYLAHFRSGVNPIDEEIISLLN